MRNVHEALSKAIPFFLLASVHAINSWSHAVSDGLYTISGTSFVSVASASPWPEYDRNIQSTGESKMVTSDTAGRLKWSYTTENFVKSSPAVGSDGTVYVESDDFKLYAINPDGRFKWSYTIGGYLYSSPAIGADGAIYIASDDGKLYAIK